MCISKWFGGGGDGGAAAAALQLANQQQAQSAAAIASAGLDTEQSRQAAEATLRKAAASQGFSSTLFGTGQSNPSPSVAYKTLFGA